MAASSSRQLSEEIDRLLEHYLALLHQYDTLHTSLSTAQSSIQQSLARANFNAPRGVRYGQDLYDGRMQATRVCRVTASPESDTAVLTVTIPSAHTENEDHTRTPAFADAGEKIPDEGEQEDAGKRGSTGKDPIRMFGILIPRELRDAQGESLKMVEELVPMLVGVDMEMREVEIRIRRARKFRGKAEERERSEAKGEREGKGREAVTA